MKVPASDPGRQKVVPALARAIAIIRHLGTQAGATLTEISRAHTLNTSTCFNILQGLLAEGLVTFDPRTRRYALGVGLLELSAPMLRRGAGSAELRGLLANYAQRHDVTMVLWRRTAEETLKVIASAEGIGKLRIHVLPGQHMPMLSGAAGRCVAAHCGLPREALRRRFQLLVWQRPLAFATYLRQVNEARSSGVAVDEGYRTSGVHALAAPILAHDGTAAFCVSAIMFRGQQDLRRLRSLASDTSAVAETIGTVLVARA